MQKQIDLGIISMVDAAEEIAMIKEKEFKIKKQLVDAVHASAISKHGATKGYQNGYYYTRLDSRKQLKAKDLASLYDKLYQIYYSTQYKPKSIGAIFEMAIKEKEDTENPKQATIARLKHDYCRYISDELATKNISEVDHFELRRYTQNLVNSISLTKKQFLAYKGVLNLIYGYAIEHDIIDKNPVARIKNSVYMKSCDTTKAKPEDKIFTQEEIQKLLDVCEKRIESGYYVHGYAMKFAIFTGVRAGELCAVRWEDINFENSTIHIHGQQLMHKINGHNDYYYVPYTKNERGMSDDGRYFPLTDEIRDMLLEIRGWQDKLGISPEFIFSHDNGEWIKTTAYESYLRRICRKCKLRLTNNHAFRMSLNSNVLIQNGVAVTDRAKLLGHSVTTNLNCYSYAQKDVVDRMRDLLNDVNSEKEPNCCEKEPPGVMIFDNKKALKRLV